MHILIVAPSLDLKMNVSGVSAVANFIIEHNTECEYVHFLQGRSDGERGALNRIIRIWRNYRAWKRIVNGNDNVNENETLRYDTRGYDNENGNGNENENGNGKVVIHYNYPLDAASIVRDFFFMKVAHQRGLPMVIHIHGGLYLFKEKQPFFIKRILSEVFSWENPFIVLSDKEREQIKRLYGTKNVVVLPNCVTVPTYNDTRSYDTLRYDTERGSYDTRGYENDNGNGLQMLYLGRIEPNKGMDYLLEAMRILKEEGRAFTLHFAGVEQGKNGYIERFQSLLGERFIYEGVVSGNQKTNLFKRCHVFVLPSFYEGLPISLLETMSYGLVPVVTDVGSIGEYVKDEENGLLLKVKDSQSIVEAIDKLGSDGKLLQGLSKNARQTISERFNPADYIKKLNSIYGQAVRS